MAVNRHSNDVTSLNRQQTEPFVPIDAERRAEQRRQLNDRLDKNALKKFSDKIDKGQLDEDVLKAIECGEQTPGLTAIQKRQVRVLKPLVEKNPSMPELFRLEVNNQKQYLNLKRELAELKSTDHVLETIANVLETPSSQVNCTISIKEKKVTYIPKPSCSNPLYLLTMVFFRAFRETFIDLIFNKIFAV